MPVKTGIQVRSSQKHEDSMDSACAGMTKKKSGFAKRQMKNRTAWT